MSPSSSRDWAKARQRELLARPAGSDPAWWIVFARKGSRCSNCGNETYGQPIALQYDADLTYCKACWERFGLDPKPSKNYLKGLQSAAQQQPSKGRKARRRRKRGGQSAAK